jgi:hypothetical protein
MQPHESVINDVDITVMNDELARIVMKPEEAYVCVLCQHLPGAEKNHETLSSGKPEERSTFEP